MSETTDCAKRAVRIKALRAKAASTEYPAERDTLNDKADELQAKNDAVGYVDPDEAKRRDSVFSDFWAQCVADQRKADSDARVRKYQEYIRRNEARQSECIHQWRVVFSAESLKLVKYCAGCGKQSPLDDYVDPGNYRDEAPGPKTGARRRQSAPTGERHARVDHSQCYAEGLHDKSKAGRASCRRGTV